MLSSMLVSAVLALGAVTDTTAAARADDGPVTIRFENQGWDLATVYAVPDHGIAVRLGQVSPGATAKLVVPRSVTTGLGSIDIVAVPFARRFAVSSGSVLVSPGTELRATLSSAENAVWVLPGSR